MLTHSLTMLETDISLPQTNAFSKILAKPWPYFLYHARPHLGRG